MNDPDPHDERDRDDDPGRRSDARVDPASVVHLGIDVGIRSLARLLGGGGTSRPNRGEWQRVDEPARDDAEGTTGTEVPAADGPVDVADEYLVDTHRTEDELVVTAELPGVSEEDLSVGIDVGSNTLVVAVDGRTVDRISLPWSSTDATKVWYNNAILEVRLRPVDDQGGEGDGA